MTKIGNPFINITTLLISLLVAFSIEAKIYDFTEGNKITLLKDARLAAQLKLDMIKKAKHHIHIMSYYVDKTDFSLEFVKELRNAHKRGVHIRFLATSAPSLAVDFFRKSKEELFLNSFTEKSDATLLYLFFNTSKTMSYFNSVHEKIFLVDGKQVIIGGRNITENSFKAKDLEVLLEGPIVNQAQEHFNKMLTFLINLEIFEECSNTNLTCIKALANSNFKMTDPIYLPVQKNFPEGFKARVLTNEVLFDQYAHNYTGEEKFKVKDDIIDTVIKTKFNKMQAYNYFMIPTDRYKDFLLKNFGQGKRIEIITNSLFSASAVTSLGYLYSLQVLQSLVDIGLIIYEWIGTKEDKFGNNEVIYLHEKLILFDDEHVFLGSHNFGEGSTSVSSEIEIEFFSKDIAKDLSDVFESEKINKKLTFRPSRSFLQSELEENRMENNFIHMYKIRNAIREFY